MNTKLHKIVDGKRINLNDIEIKEYNLKQNIKIDINKIKQNKIRELKYNCSNYIYSIYPQFKQINITNQINATEEDLINMKQFIREQINICNEKENLINNSKNLEDLNLIKIDFEY